MLVWVGFWLLNCSESNAAYLHTGFVFKPLSHGRRFEQFSHGIVENGDEAKTENETAECSRSKQTCRRQQRNVQNTCRMCSTVVCCFNSCFVMLLLFDKSFPKKKISKSEKPKIPTRYIGREFVMSKVKRPVDDWPVGQWWSLLFIC